ncbi:NADPH dehydrogenase [Desulfotomaculum nigrificans CO-1-SRB]|uniref:NADPH dehydrogenase n=1 Tax=Desulfotomaculum nigrificans (strain DSM 14880 / VKM B-2319 / CO-1-SRB) TaxID=868595 RepID=F6B2N3_DESCC|nr:NADPH dehydrogenase NamA [Desulfotomaculum nigrificans]AEF93862.1 NADPH dehydrogenase [Desulfotomaculum nigrificans CO-1-SRB]
MLFSDFTVKNLTLKNRIVMPPMCMYRADKEALANDWHFIHYATRAIGQVGLIIMEATGVEDRGRITSRDLGLWHDGQVAGIKRIVDAVHANGSKIAIQLNHAGRKSEVEYLDPVGPSAIAYSDKYRTPRELSRDEIKEIVGLFAAAARRAVTAGFDAIEIHGAHGYLISEFLSPLTNKRQDEYGGSPENRVRFLGEVLKAVKGVLPNDMPLIVRVSAHDIEPGGNTPEDMAQMLNLVKDIGIDLVNVSSGGVTPVAPKSYPSYQIPYAITIKEKTGLPVIGGGLVNDPLQAEQIVKSGVDLVYIGRELLRNPYWPLHAAFILREDITWPEPYLRSKLV